MKVKTEYVFPPIPSRNFDWSAIDEDTYDGAPDSHCPLGSGDTEQDAIDDLLQQMKERDMICQMYFDLTSCASHTISHCDECEASFCPGHLRACPDCSEILCFEPSGLTGTCYQNHACKKVPAAAQSLIERELQRPA